MSPPLTTEKISLFLPNVEGGGAEKVMLKIAHGLLEKGRTVELILAQARGAYLPEIPRQLPVVDLGHSYIWAALPALVRHLRSSRPQVMLSFMEDPNLLALWARPLSGVPFRLVISVRASLAWALREVPPLRRAIKRRLLARYYPHADRVIAVSRGVADELQQLLPLPKHKIEVVYNPTLTPDLEEKARRDPGHPWLAAGQPPVILAVGRLHPQKDYPTLLRAFAQVRRHAHCRLMILGQGEERPQLEALIDELGLTEAVALPGFTDNPYASMARARLFVLSSLYEGLPNALIEALACGAPAVATDCPFGPAEILEGGRLGALVPPGDVSALALAIQHSLERPRRSCPPQALEKFRAEIVTRQYMDLLMPDAPAKPEGFA